LPLIISNEKTVKTDSSTQRNSSSEKEMFSYTHTKSVKKKFRVDCLQLKKPDEIFRKRIKFYSTGKAIVP